MAPRAQSGVPKSQSLPSLSTLLRRPPALGQGTWPEPAVPPSGPQASPVLASCPSQQLSPVGKPHLACVPGLPADETGPEKRLSDGHKSGRGTTPSRSYRGLLLDILQMRQADVEQLGGHISSIAGSDGTKLRQAFRTRAAEMLGTVSLGELDSARQTLAVVKTMDEDLLRDDFWTSSSDPTRALEERIGQLAFQSRDQLDALLRCHRAATQLANAGLMRKKAHDVATACLSVWLQRATLPEVRRQAGAVRDLVASEPQLRLALQHRLVQRARETFPPGQFRGFAQLLLDLQRSGMEVLDSSKRLELDPLSAQSLPPLQVALLGVLRYSLSRWPMRRLAREFHGPLLELSNARKDLSANVCAAASARVLEGLWAVYQMIKREVPGLRVQEEVALWGQFFCNVHGAGLLSLSEQERWTIVAAHCDPGSLANCCAAVTPGATEFLIAYRGHMQELQVRAQELEDLVTTVRSLLSPPTRVDPGSPPTDASS